ncbi:MAG: molybdopterin-dependent oxidoreductase [Alphaproteobacteria bacterium]|nr:molybdopterin-dependent oxidoreductase [Alphaproteobacteria bacterium]
MTKTPNSVTMDESAERIILDRGVQGLVGKSVARIEGPLKTSGRADYANDTKLDGAAYGFVLTSEISLGRIKAIDVAAARSAAGVLAVIVDHPLLPSDGSAGNASLKRVPRDLPEVDSYGQAIGIVVAESFEAARSAARLVRVDYDEREGRYDTTRHLEDVEHEPKGGLIPDIKRGDIDAVMASAPVTLDITYTTPHYFPAAMEPHATVATWTGDGVEIHSSLQLLKTARAMIAASLDLDLSKVRVLAPYVGGGFGGKTGTGPEVILAAIASKETGRPVKVALTRRQTAHLVHHRADTHQRIRIACDDEGHILGIGHNSIVSQKAGRSFIEPVSLGTLAMYKGEARSFTQSAVRLNIPVAGAVRAPGEAVGSLALETAMDELAERFGMDPIAFRKLNEPEKDPLRGSPFSTRRLVDCYDEGARRFGWDRRNPTPGEVRDGEWLVGMGMAAATRINLLQESHARVSLRLDGGALVETDMTDIGTGTYTILAQIAGEMLGLPIDRIEVRLGDTNLPPSSGSGGSFGAASSGSSVALACETIIAELARRMDVSPDQLVLKDGVATARNVQSSLVDLLDGDDIAAEGVIKPGKTARAYSQAAHGAQFAEVGVNAVTGEVRVRRMLAVFDCGRILNARTARNQAIGGMIWGISYALHEEAVVDKRTGAFVTRDLAEYHVPVSADVPAVEAYFIEDPDRHANPLGVKGIGELGNAGAGAAVTNAIYNACGVRVRDFPMTLDKILAGLGPV